MKVWLSVVVLVIFSILAAYGAGDEKIPGIENGLQLSRNRFAPPEQRYSYEGVSRVPSSWKMVNAKGQAVIATEKASKKPIGQGTLLFKETVYVQTEFAPPKGPWSFQTAIDFSLGGGYVVFNNFETWKDEFVYPDTLNKLQGLPTQATAKNKAGKILASVKVSRFITDAGFNQFVGVEVVETHFGQNGKVSFRCVSQFEHPSGLKRFEKVLSGKKEKEYFPIWPVSTIM